MRNMEKIKNLSDKRRVSRQVGRPVLTALLVAAAFATPVSATAATPVTPLHNKMLYLKIVRFTDGRDRAYAYVTTPMNYNGWQTMDIGSKQLSNGEVAKMTGGLPPLDVAGIRHALTNYRKAYEGVARYYDVCADEWAKYENSYGRISKYVRVEHAKYESVLTDEWGYLYTPPQKTLKTCLDNGI